MTGLIYALINILVMVATAISWIVIAQFIISLLFSFNVISPSNRFLTEVYISINKLLDPLLRPIRRLLPDTGMIDFSPMVLILLLSGLIRLLDAALQ